MFLLRSELDFSVENPYRNGGQHILPCASLGQTTYVLRDIAVIRFNCIVLINIVRLIALKNPKYFCCAP